MKLYIEILFNLIGIAVGFMFIVDPYDYVRGFPVPKATGYIVIFISIYYLIKTVAERKRTDADNYYKCSKCGEIAYKTEIVNGICKSCGGKVVDLRGYYKKDPDL